VHLVLICHSSRSEETALKKEWHFYVYIIASRSRILYIGITNDIRRRMREHKEAVVDGFAKRYRINRLVYYESFKYVNNAIQRETELKKWNAQRKLP
jgi:putative endonuclease